MALSFDLRAIEDRESNYPPRENGAMNVVTETMIFGAMITGIGTITDANAPEFYARLHMAEQLCGPLVYMNGQPYSITPDDVQAHVGMKTNVFPQESRAKWIARYVTPKLTESVQTFKRGI